MKAVIARKVIVMAKAEAKAAGIYGTVEFEELANLRKEFPDFRIETKSSKSKDNMKGLDTKFMEKYIKEHDDEDHSIALTPIRRYRCGAVSMVTCRPCFCRRKAFPL